MHIDGDQVRFDTVSIGRADNNAGIFVGDNVQCAWQSVHGESKSGFGRICGNRNALRRNHAIVIRRGAASGTN